MGSVVPPLPHPADWSREDHSFMQRALELALRAAAADEIPVGAVLVRGSRILGEGWNHPIQSTDPTSHAEIEAIRQACLAQSNYRLAGSTLYVTLEPCIMCVGAILNARVSRVVYGARDLRFGALRSKFRLGDSDLLNHRARVEEGLLAVESATLLKDFFNGRRMEGETRSS